MKRKRREIAKKIHQQKQWPGQEFGIMNNSNKHYVCWLKWNEKKRRFADTSLLKVWRKNKYKIFADAEIMSGVGGDLSEDMCN